MAKAILDQSCSLASEEVEFVLFHAHPPSSPTITLPGTRRRRTTPLPWSRGPWTGRTGGRCFPGSAAGGCTMAWGPACRMRGAAACPRSGHGLPAHPSALAAAAVPGVGALAPRARIHPVLLVEWGVSRRWIDHQPTQAGRTTHPPRTGHGLRPRCGRLPFGRRQTQRPAVGVSCRAGAERGRGIAWVYHRSVDD